MKKKLSMVYLIALSILLLLSAAGCAEKKQGSQPPAQTQKVEAVSVDVGLLKGSTAVGLVKMMEDQQSLGEGVTVNYLVEQSPDILTAKLINKEIEVATVPTNIAAKLYNQGIPYQLAAMNTWGVMYVLTNGVNIKDWADLKGQQIGVTGKGAASDVVFRYILDKNGIKADQDVSLNYTLSPVELAQLMIAGKSSIAVLPEPWVSTVISKNNQVKVALDLQKEWTRLNGENVPFAQTCLVINSEFSQKHPEIVDKLLKQCAQSIAWVNKNPAQAGSLFVKHNLGIAAEVAESAVPRCNLRYIDGIEARPAVEKYLQVLLAFSPESIGGKLPDEKFYYQK